MSQTTKILFVSALINAISWIILIPLWQYPDEQSHFAQIQYIAEIGGIPEGSKSQDTSYEVAISEKILGTERDNLGNNKFTYHPEFHSNYSNTIFGPKETEISSLPKSQRRNLIKNEATLNPPLYKIFSAGNLFTRVYALRMFSTLIFIGTILLAYKIGQLIFEKNKVLPIALCTIIAFKPMLVFSSTGVLPDTLTNFLFTLFIFICLKIIYENLSAAKVISLLVVIILGALTRQHFLITLLIVPFVIIEQFLFNKKSRKMIIFSSISFLAVLYTLSFFIGPLSFIRTLDYPESSQKIIGNPLSNMTYLEHLKWTVKHTISEVWPWYWGIYKWLSLSLPPLSYQIINRLIPLSVLGLVFKIFEIIKSRQIKKNIPFMFLFLIITIYIFALTTFDYFFRKNNGFSFGIQGRYFFPTIVAQMALLLIGFEKLFSLVLGRYSKYGLFLIVTSMVVFNIFSLSFVSSSYYDLSSTETFISQVSQYKPLIIKGNILFLVFGAALFSQSLFLFNFARDVLKLKS